MTTTERTFTGRHMLFIMLAFFATVLAANLTMVYFASHSWTGLVVKNSYVASQEFNETTAKLEQAEKGFHVTPAYDAGRLTIALTDDRQHPFIASEVRVKIGRPSHEGEDQTLTLTWQKDGVYGATVTLGKGQWTGMLTAKAQGHDEWQRPIRIFVKE